uniref:Uncharacterized protein n=1 Tax=Rhizophora mucronata TaxID=61149 RepID=A0A2P2NJ91_RHIMU
MLAGTIEKLVIMGNFLSNKTVFNSCNFSLAPRDLRWDRDGFDVQCIY